MTRGSRRDRRPVAGSEVRRAATRGGTVGWAWGSFARPESWLRASKASGAEPSRGSELSGAERAGGNEPSQACPSPKVSQKGEDQVGVPRARFESVSI